MLGNTRNQSLSEAGTTLVEQNAILREIHWEQ
jgi:hypothetical protein